MLANELWSFPTVRALRHAMRLWGFGQHRWPHSSNETRQPQWTLREAPKTCQDLPWLTTCLGFLLRSFQLGVSSHNDSAMITLWQLWWPEPRSPKSDRGKTASRFLPYSPVDRGKFPRAGALEEKIQVDGIFHGIFLVMAFLDGFWRCFFAISRPVAMVEAMWWNAATGGVWSWSKPNSKPSAFFFYGFFGKIVRCILS